MADPLAQYDEIFKAAGEEWNIDPLVLRAMAMQESKGNPRAISKAGALGLMQIMPDTQRRLGVTNPFDPVESIFGAAKYMNQALEKEGSLEGALLNYHGGDGWKQSFGRESRDYVPAIAGHYKRFQAAQRPTPTQQAAVAAPQAPQEPQ